MKSFKNKLIPTVVNEISGVGDQNDYCNNSECEKDEEIDCGNCLFSEKFCKKDIFEEYILNKEDNDE